MIPLNYHHLYYFYVIAKSGSVSAAGKTLFLAQPTLSAQLKQFERFLKRPLFERRRQRLHLTEDGRRVLDYAESIFEMGRELQDVLRDNPAPGRVALQIGIMTGTPRAFGHALLEAAYARDSGVHVEVREGILDDILEDLREQKLDLVLTDIPIRSREREEFANRLAGRVPIVFAASPAAARGLKKIPADFNGAPMILPSPPSPVFPKLQELFAAWNVEPRIVAEVQDMELARRLAVGGRGVAPLNAYTVSVSVPRGGLKIVASGEKWGLFESVHLVKRRRKWPNPLAESLFNTFSVPT